MEKEALKKELKDSNPKKKKKKKKRKNKAKTTQTNDAQSFSIISYPLFPIDTLILNTIVN